MFEEARVLGVGLVYTSVTLLLLCLLLPLTAFAGFGVSPSLFQEDNLVPGASLKRTFYLVQGTPVGDIDVEIVVESEEVKEWFTVLGAEDNIVRIPAGVQQFPVTVLIHVPQDADLGIYKAFVRANTLPSRSTGQVTIALAAKTVFNLIVGDNVISEYKVHEIHIPDIGPGQSPRATLTLRNTGNIPAGPDAATFELFNKFGDLRLAYGQVTDLSETVEAFSEGSISLNFPIDIQIGIGEYWGHVKVYDDNVLVKELKTVFEVKEGINDPASEEPVDDDSTLANVLSFLGREYAIPPAALMAAGALAGILILFSVKAIVRMLFFRKRRKTAV